MAEDAAVLVEGERVVEVAAAKVELLADELLLELFFGDGAGRGGRFAGAVAGVVAGAGASAGG